MISTETFWLPWRIILASGGWPKPSADEIWELDEVEKSIGCLFLLELDFGIELELELEVKLGPGPEPGPPELELELELGPGCWLGRAVNPFRKPWPFLESEDLKTSNCWKVGCWSKKEVIASQNATCSFELIIVNNSPVRGSITQTKGNFSVR